MGMTMTQKILAAHCGETTVKAGQLINAKLDIVLGNDITTPVAINEFEKAGFDSVFDKTARKHRAGSLCPPTRISRAPPSPSSAGNSPTNTTSSTSTTWARWVSSTPSCPRRASSLGGRLHHRRRQPHLHPTVRWALSPPAWAPTDMAAGMAKGVAWFKVPAAIKVVLTGSLHRPVSGKDVILHLIGGDRRLGRFVQEPRVHPGDGVRSLTMEGPPLHLQYGHRGRAPRTVSSRWTKFCEGLSQGAAASAPG